MANILSVFFLYSTNYTSKQCHLYQE